MNVQSFPLREVIFFFLLRSLCKILCKLVCDMNMTNFCARLGRDKLGFAATPAATTAMFSVDLLNVHELESSQH